VAEFAVGGVSIPHAPLTAETLKGVDAVVVVTDHADIDYGLVVESSALILDTRNALKAFSDDKVVRL